MARRRVLQPDPGPGGVELLSEVADPAVFSGAAGPSNERLPLIVALAVVFGLGLILLVAGPVLPEPEPEPGRVAPLQFGFGDPFALDWIELPQVSGAVVAGERPQPMVGSDGRCLGFARSDWPAEDRHPSVAHCLDRQGVERFAGADAVGVHRIVAGPETWYFLFFGGPVAELEIAIEADPGGETIAGPPPVHQGETIVAILVPTSAAEISVGWRRVGGARYRTSVS